MIAIVLHCWGSVLNTAPTLRTKLSNDLARFINSRRRHKTDVAIARQLKIAKDHNRVVSDANPKLVQGHRFAKHHAMDCGNPKCFMCGNPRKTHKDRLTAQEKRLFQNLDSQRNHHTNGTKDHHD